MENPSKINNFKDSGKQGGESKRTTVLKDVAERQDISEKYLEIIVKKLVKGGLLDAMRVKRGGGYRLNRPPEEYGVWAILELPVACLAPGHGGCPREAGCWTFPLWRGLNRVISDYLAQYTLVDLYGERE